MTAVQAQEFYDYLWRLRLDSYIKIDLENTGFYSIPDTIDSLDEAGTFKTTYIDYPATDFVIRAVASWETGEEPETYDESGCGFVFREESPGNHYLMYFGVDGRIHFGRVVDGELLLINQSNVAPIQSPSGSAEILLSVNKNSFTTFVNVAGRRTFFYPLDSVFKTGEKLGLAVVSGTSLGTNCKMENIELAVPGGGINNTP